jgi:hypothetical protein
MVIHDEDSRLSPIILFLIAPRFVALRFVQMGAWKHSRARTDCCTASSGTRRRCMPKAVRDHLARGPCAMLAQLQPARFDPQC